MMTKNELSQLYYLNREIEQLKIRQRELKTIAEGTTTRITGLPFGTGISDKIGNYASDLADLDTLIAISLQKCWQEIKRLNQFINTIDDSQLRQIFSLRYINGLTWQQIAFAIGESDESYPRRKHNTFLKAAENAESSVIIS
ncbi:hypothetical protein [Clostridium aminobutyricum]|uniref:DUF1492 domain-containing protein n=1 Tax=Clostridium aminobutyricum TaxID=33953 RepID=A0A939IH57_CLOAM|nr:hypothetical protein [Clostridium aminobutyricum]MBN7773172.1 hypothetical protein [Clostridium aminobutyricum]